MNYELFNQVEIGLAVFSSENKLLFVNHFLKKNLPQWRGDAADSFGQFFSCMNYEKLQTCSCEECPLRKQLTLARKTQQRQETEYWHHFDEAGRDRSYCFRIISSPLPSGDLITTFKDITYHKKLEEDLMDRTEEIELLLKEKKKIQTMAKHQTNFLSAILHDLSSPLGIINTASSLLKVKLAEATPNHGSNELFEISGMIDSSINVAIGYIDEIRQTFSRQGLEEAAPLQLADFLQDLKSIYAYKLVSKEAKLELHIDQSIYLWTTRLLAASVFRRLLGNSLRHGFKEGQEGRIIIFATLTKDQIVIKCRDNGHRSYKGHQEDLVMIRSIVTELWQGSLEAVTDEEGGMTVSIYLPRDVHKQG